MQHSVARKPLALLRCCTTAPTQVPPKLWAFAAANATALAHELSVTRQERKAYGYSRAQRFGGILSKR